MKLDVGFTPVEQEKSWINPIKDFYKKIKNRKNRKGGKLNMGIRENNATIRSSEYYDGVRFSNHIPIGSRVWDSPDHVHSGITTDGHVYRNPLDVNVIVTDVDGIPGLKQLWPHSHVELVSQDWI